MPSSHRHRKPVRALQGLACLLVPAVLLLTSACVPLRPLPPGVGMTGPVRPCPDAVLLRDLTYMTPAERRCSDQEIFAAIFDMIDAAESLVLADMFLYNDWTGTESAPHRPLSSQFTEALLRKKRASPDCHVILITDPINTLYGGQSAPHLDALRQAGVTVIITDLTRLRDSNPLYSVWWRTLARPFGNGRGGVLPNPFGEGQASVRTYLSLLNFKANHRKVVIADPAGTLTGLVTSANPHDGSSAHSNIAVRFTGPAVIDLLDSEIAVARFSGVDLELPPGIVTADHGDAGDATIQVVTERAIKEAILQTLRRVERNDRVDVVMFYFSDRTILRALIAAHARGARVRVTLDPNKDAFGHQKNGIPNRQVAGDLVKAGVPIRWYNTNGEQCHIKMMLVRKQDGNGNLIAGSANFTRRNLNNLNLESNVVLRAPRGSPAIEKAAKLVDDIWMNRQHRYCTVPYEAYRDPSVLNYMRYVFMEWSGMSTF